MLEILVHTRIGKIPATMVIESVSRRQLASGWDLPEAVIARKFGDRWIHELRTAVLFVPSVVTGDEGNVVINPLHPDARKIRASKPTPVIWNSRLFMQPGER